MRTTFLFFKTERTWWERRKPRLRNIKIARRFYRQTWDFFVVADSLGGKHRLTMAMLLPVSQIKFIFPKPNHAFWSVEDQIRVSDGCRSLGPAVKWAMGPASLMIAGIDRWPFLKYFIVSGIGGKQALSKCPPTRVSRAKLNLDVIPVVLICTHVRLDAGISRTLSQFYKFDIRRWPTAYAESLYQLGIISLHRKPPTELACPPSLSNARLFLA